MVAPFEGVGGLADMINSRRAGMLAVARGDLAAAQSHANNATRAWMSAVPELAVGGPFAVGLGKAGEVAVRGVANIGSKVAFRVNGRLRIADGFLSRY